MNVYEETHNLNKAIKESEEYKQYKNASDRIKENPELDKMMKDFMEKQLEVQTKQMLGEKVSAEMMEGIQKLSSVVMTDPLAAEYVQCQMRFSVMVQDIYKILGETIGVGQ